MSNDFSEYLQKKLDKEQRGQRNWYNVGIKLEVPKDDLNDLKLEYKKDHGSPTSCLLGILAARGEDEPTVKDFLETLRQLGRKDIAYGWDWDNNKAKPKNN